MSIKPLPTILFATATALALTACGSSSTPSAPTASAAASSAAAADPSTAPLRGIVIASTEYDYDNTTDTITAYDPATGEVTATRTFTVPSEYTTYTGGACVREHCYSPDFERVLAIDTSGGNERVAVASSDGSFTLLNDLIPVPQGSRSYSNAYAKFGSDGSIYVAHEDKPDDGDFVGTLYRFASETEAPEAVPTTFTVSNTQDFQILPDSTPIAIGYYAWAANNSGIGCYGALAVTSDGTCLTVDKDAVYSKKGKPLSQTTESDKSLRIEEWTKVNLPNLEGTHEIVKTLRLSPDGTRMALLAPFKKLEDDMSFQLYSAPVGGGEATQLTKATDIAGSKHIILAWSE